MKLKFWLFMGLSYLLLMMPILLAVAVLKDEGGLGVPN